MKVMIPLWVVFFAMISSCIAQDKPAAKGVFAYAELAGAAWKYSANVEYEFLKASSFALNARVGTGIGTVDNSQIKRTYIGIPVGIVAVSGKGKHHPELGLNVSYLQGRYAIPESIGGYGGGVAVEGQPGKEIILSPSLGYRFQQPRGGFFAKILWTPLFKMADLTKEGKSEGMYPESAYAWRGLSAGYYFMRKG